jgi:photosystem II stability/assembly factor-like uncharacterized protein
MVQKLLITSLLSIFLCLNASAQTWREMMNEPKYYSFKDVTANFYEEERRLYAEDSVAASKRKGIKSFKRWEWFWQQRLNADGSFPDLNKHFDAWKAFENSTQQNVNNATAHTTQTQVVPSFTSLGPFNPPSTFPAYGIGNIVKMSFHPTNNNIFYAVSNGGHIWKTTDGGNSYQSITDFLPNKIIRDIAVDRTNGNRILFTNNRENKLYQTLDGGLTWTTMAIPIVFKEIEQDPIDANTWVAIGNYSQIYKSTDNGINWVVKTGSLSQQEISNLTFKPGSSTTLYCIKFDNPGGPGVRLLRSTDGGTLWTETFIFTGSHYWDATLATVSTSPDVVEVLTANVNQYAMGALYKSIDGGVTFTKTYDGASPSTNLLGYSVPPNALDGQAWRNRVLCINPNNINQQFIGGIYNWRTNDGGLTWQPLNTASVHVDQQFMAYNPYNLGVLYLSNDGGIYKSNDNGANWIRISNGLVCSQIYKVSTPQAASAGPQTHIIGLQDNGTNLRRNNGLWEVPTGGDGMDNAIDPINSDFIYTSSQNGNFYRMQLSNIGVVTAISPSSNGAWVTPIAVDTSFRINATQPPKLFIAYPNGIFKSSNRGSSWSVVPNTPWPSSFYPTHLIVSDTNTIIVSNYDDVWRTNNNGITWTKILTGTPNNYNFRAFTVDPQNKNRIWVTTNSASLGYVIYSADGGTTWQNNTYNLPVGNYNSIEIQKIPAEVIYVGSDNGIAIKGAAATSWSEYGTGLPYVAINEIQLDKNNNQIAVATYGRGLWTVPAYTLQNGGTCTVTNGSSFNSGNNMNVKFNFERLFFNAGNVYTVQLSDGNGSFAAPTNLGTKTSSNGLDSTTVITPNNLPCGTNYRIRVIANNGADTTSITTPITMLAKPDARITNAAAANGICPGGNLSLNALVVAGYTYQWKLNGTDIAGATSSSYTASAAGNYQVKASFSCGDSTSTIYAVVIIPKPNAVITPASSTTICAGANVVLNTITGTGLTYQWRKDGTDIPSATTNSYTANATGQYAVKVTNSTGCDSISLPTTVTVNAIPATPTISAGGAIAFCAGASVTLTSNATTGNQWYNGATTITGATNATYSATSAGVYTNKVTTSGCTSAASNAITTTVNPLPTAPPINWNSSQFSTTTGLASYKWYLNNTIISGATAATYTPTATGIYKVEITDANGCSNTSADYNLVSTGLNTVQVEGTRIDVLPNPANQYITLKVSRANGNSKLNVTLFNNTGKRIQQQTVQNGTINISVSNVPAGNYMLYIKGVKETQSVQITIIH